MADLIKKWKHIGNNVYRHVDTGELKSERVDAEMQELPVGFRLVGEIPLNDLTGLVE